MQFPQITGKDCWFLFNSKHLPTFKGSCSMTPSLYLQYVHFLQRKYSLSSFNLLGHTAPGQAATLLLVGPFLDYWLTNKRVDAFEFNMASLVSITTIYMLGEHIVTRLHFIYSQSPIPCCKRSLVHWLWPWMLLSSWMEAWWMQLQPSIQTKPIWLYELVYGFHN